MQIFNILDADEINEFENPPQFSYPQRKAFFEITIDLKAFTFSKSTPANDIGLVLQFGYFRATGRFFKVTNFNETDIVYVCRKLKLERSVFNLKNYSSSTLSRHRQLILAGLGIKRFKGKAQELVITESKHLVTKQYNPESVFKSLCDFIRSHSIEVPSYNTLAMIITKSLKEFELQLTQKINLALNSQQKIQLDELLELNTDENNTRNTYIITKYKSIEELMKLSSIRDNMNKLKELKLLYHSLNEVILALNLSEELVEYYANYVLSSRVLQLKQRNHRHLYLLCFIKFQYHYINDIAIQTFMSVSQQTFRQAENRKKELLLEWQKANQASQEEILLAVIQEAPLIKKLQETAFSFEKTKDEKFDLLIENIKNPQHEHFLKLIPDAEKLYNQSVKKLESKLLYESISEKSRSFQTKVADMLRNLEFGAVMPENKVIKALSHYQKKQGNISATAPMDFLSKQEKENVQSPDTGFNDSLYKTLLAQHIHKSLKSGRINVAVSHQFKAFEDYMMDSKEWEENREYLMERAGFSQFSKCKNLQETLEDRLTMQFIETFNAINKGDNEFVKKRKNNTLRFITPSKKPEKPIIDLYPPDLYVSIFEVFHTVNQHTGFTKKLTHKMDLYNRNTMPDKVNFAAIIGWGTNLGISTMAKKIKKTISLESLQKVSNWHLSSKNLLTANDVIVQYMNRLPINILFKEDKNLIRTASDGQKYTMALDSIHANYSSKYFGKEKGIVVYSFTAEHGPVFYTLSFSAGDYEAWYIIDGLLHFQTVFPYTIKKKEIPRIVDTESSQELEEVPNHMHSTDQHGINYINSAICFFLGIEFQPRFKQIHKVKLFGIEGMKIQQQTDYQINAGNNINTAIIEEQWDNILRLMVTIKLKHTTPSVLLKRLTSYSNKHPLNIALQELGKVIQTIFVLKYMHFPELRRVINQNLTKTESMHQLSDELNLGHDGLIQFATKEELLMMARSKQIIINSIACYNYLYNTKNLYLASDTQRNEIKQELKQSSPLAYAHFNFQGEYDLSDDVLKNALKLDSDEILFFDL